MIGYFPTPYPDELLYSVCARYCDWSPYVSSHSGAGELLPDIHQKLDAEFLGTISDDTYRMMTQNCTPSELIMQHTMFPYRARFLPLQRRKLVLHSAFIRKSDVTRQMVRAKTRYYSFEGDKPLYLRYCPVCAKEDRKSYGEAYQFYPNCRIRFIRYDGTIAQPGTRMNIIRDYSVEQPLLRIIDEAKKFISTQLREFTMLDVRTGRFQTVPEYPEFAWQEGIVNAVTHREYGLSGNYIKVSMYDDRLEIESPGKLPSIVTVGNIRETRYARNSRISRVLTEFGWVRELNEGVARIYNDMEAFFLDDPVYSEPGESVKLTLYNNIVMRTLRQKGHAVESVGPDVWKKLDVIERALLTFLVNHGPAKRKQLAEYVKKSSGTVIGRLNHLMEMELVVTSSSQYDPGKTYEANLSDCIKN